MAFIHSEIIPYWSQATNLDKVFYDERTSSLATKLVVCVLSWINCLKITLTTKHPVFFWLGDFIFKVENLNQWKVMIEVYVNRTLRMK